MARRIDPRAEPESLRPDAPAPIAPAPTDVVNVPSGAIEASPDTSPEVVGAPAPHEEAPPSSRVTNVDPRIEGVEEALVRGDWSRVAKDLGKVEDAGSLPPNLGLVCALAHAESSTDAVGANELAIRCMAAIFGVAPESRLALLLAKRLLRKNPVAWRQRAAPPARVSLLIVLVTLVVGGAVGWLLTSGIVKIRF